ncbi:MAG TPA: tryptophan--tRNA ligase [Candidatus Saccharimonadales bacterium]|nr:tryptophan--tRNA ligase [Candidatus Saccharimonadales bacterium]
MNKPVILTGLRANNNLHIGNYFGSLLPIVELAKQKSNEFQINLFVPDLHSFTTPIDHSLLQDSIMNNLRTYISAGLPIDNTDVHIYRQSYIPAHSELTVILDCFTGMGEMNRMTQFKDKSEGLNDDRISVGLFNYPVLMAADILLYDALYIPVGEDQTQHLEFARDIAERMNNRFGELFVVPKPVKEQHAFFGKEQGLRIKDLSDPIKKMSKSDDTGKGVIFMTDSPEIATKKIMSATTDSLSSINYDKDNQPGIANLLDLLALITNDNIEKVVSRYKGQTSYGPLKTELAEQMSSFLTKFQSAYSSVNNEELMDKLINSEESMNVQANSVLTKVQKAVGLRS